jgi:hypothetical protein
MIIAPKRENKRIFQTEYFLGMIAISADANLQEKAKMCNPPHLP